MLYQAYQVQADIMAHVRGLARIALQGFGQMSPPVADLLAVRNLVAGYELLERAGLTHERPPFGFETVNVGGREVSVREEVTDATPFGTLLHFAKDTPTVQPKVLVVAALAGHFSTLLRGTVQTLLPEQDVYITDWTNARDIGVEHGRFGFDEYVEHLIRWLEVLGPDTHLIAVCQPCVAALAATAVLADAGSDAQPRSLTLMAGPIDTRVDPTAVDDLATTRPLSWFERNVITTVPLRYSGASRRVYPGFLQLTAFVSMNFGRHAQAHRELYQQLVDRDEAAAASTKAFYDEYFAVLDLTAEFYLETVERVFQEHQLPRGVLEYQGRRINPAAITKTALLTVEGERDDICSPGQTFPAHDLCSGIKPFRKRHHLQPGVGHYGVFSGRRWDSQIYPLVHNLILANS
ncbi:MAG: polyhydroxyalkanoate depolymerase [Acidimicrobiia bacterium]